MSLRLVGQQYASLLWRLIVVAVIVCVSAFLLTILVLAFGWSTSIASVAICIAGLFVFAVLIVGNPILVIADAARKVGLSDLVIAKVRSAFAILYWFFIAALFIYLIPADAPARFKLLYIGISAVIGLGMVAGTIGISGKELEAMARWKLGVLFVFAGLAVTLPATGDALARLRITVDDDVQRRLSGDRRQFDCGRMPTEFFRNGRAITWFVRLPNGRYDLFDRPGSHPMTNQPLVAADTTAIRAVLQQCADEKQTAAIAERSRIDQAQKQTEDSAKGVASNQAEVDRLATQRAAQAEDDRRTRYLVSSSLPKAVEYLVASSIEQNRPDPGFSTRVADFLQARGKTAATNIFSETFVVSGGFDRFFEGRGEADVPLMPLASLGKYVLLARVRVSEIRRSTTTEGLVTAFVEVTFRRVSPASGRVLDGFTATTSGPGVTEKSALSNALGRAIEQLGDRGY